MKGILFLFALFLMECFAFSSAIEDFLMSSLREGCYHPGKSTHLKISFDKSENEHGKYSAGTVASYQCDGGYEIIYNTVRKCLHNGTWTGVEPYCGINIARYGNVKAEKEVKNPANVISGMYEKCSTATKGISGIWTIELRQSTMINVVKVAIEKLQGPVHPTFTIILTSPSDETHAMTRRLNIHVQFEEERRIYSKGYTEYIYTLEPVHIKILEVRVSNTVTMPVPNLNPSKPFSVCDISIYSSATTSSHFCYENNADKNDYVIYNNTCFFINHQLENTWYSAKEHCEKLASSLANADSVELRNLFSNYLNESMNETDIRIWANSKKAPKNDTCPVFHHPLIGHVRSEWCNNSNYFFCQKDVRQCGTPDQNKKSIVRVNGKIALYSCPTGHALNGTAKRLCDQGDWKNKAPHCNVIDCGIPNITQDWILLNSSTTYGSWMRLCLDNKWKFRQCDESGQWMDRDCDSCPKEILGIQYHKNALEIIIGTVIFVIAVTWMTVAILICQRKTIKNTDKI